MEGYDWGKSSTAVRNIQSMSNCPHIPNDVNHIKCPGTLIPDDVNHSKCSGTQIPDDVNHSKCSGTPLATWLTGKEDGLARVHYSAQVNKTSCK